MHEAECLQRKGEIKEFGKGGLQMLPQLGLRMCRLPAPEAGGGRAKDAISVPSELSPFVVA